MSLFKRLTIEDALEAQWEAAWCRQKAQRKQRKLIDKIITEIGHQPLRRFDYNAIEQWGFDLRRSGLAEATIDRRFTTVRKALKRAYLKNWIKKFPEKPPVQIDNIKDRYITREEEAQLFAAIQARRGAITRRIMPHVFTFLLDTGCRVSELMKILPSHVIEDGVIFPDRKNGGKLKLPLTARARRAITALHDDTWWSHSTRHIYDRDRNIRDLALENLQSRLVHEFTAIRNAAKMPDVSLHTCRHTCGSRLAQAGVPLHIVQHFLGHRDITVTSQRYAHLAPNTLLSAVNVLEVHRGENVVSLHERRT